MRDRGAGVRHCSGAGVTARIFGGISYSRIVVNEESTDANVFSTIAFFDEKFVGSFNT
jgi:hypothetical protein